MNYLYLRLRNEARVRVDADAESSLADESGHGYSDEESIEYQESDLPTQFLGTFIQRQVTTQGQRRIQSRLHSLHINTTAGAAVANRANNPPSNDDNSGGNNTQPPPSNDDNSGPPLAMGVQQGKTKNY